MATSLLTDPSRRLALSLELFDTLSALAPRAWTELQVRLRAGNVPELRVTRGQSDLKAQDFPWLSLGLERAVLEQILLELQEDFQNHWEASWEGSTLRATREPSQRAVEFCTPHGELQQRVVLEGPETRQLLFTPTLLDLCDHELPAFESKHRRLAEEISGANDWAYASDETVLELTRSALPWKRYRAEVLGSYAFEAGEWLWAWNNPHLASKVTVASHKLRRWAQESPELSAFLRPRLPCPEAFATRLAALGASRLDSLGVYRGSYGPGAMYFVLWPEL